ACMISSPLNETGRGLAVTPLWVAFEREANFERHLPVGHRSSFNMPAGFDYLKPTQVAEGLRRLGDGVADCGLHAGRGGSDELDGLVDVVRHRSSLVARGSVTGSA